MKRISLLLFFLFSAYAVAETSYPKFSGSWIAVQQGNSGDETPYSTFEVSLKIEDATVTGSYCYVTRYGAKIDCDLEEENISGIFDTKTGVAIVNFSSSFGATGGVATLTNQNDDLTWEVMQPPTGGDYYGPSSATLKATTH
ncbi:MAG: hypothetical protein ACOH2R_19645 [Pseudomonas sp.]